MIFFTLLIGVSTALNCGPGRGCGPGELQSALSNPEAFRSLFSAYQAAEGRNYVKGEMRLRASIFRSNMQAVAAHDAETAGWAQELNMFADMTEEEKASYTGFNSSIMEENADYDVMPQWGNPDEKDWRGVAVTKVKNQGRCGSCWIFSGFGALEGHYKTQGSILKSFAEQEGLDCIQRNGCNGGYMAKVFDWLKRSGRVGATKDIRYTARRGSCRYSSKPNALIAFRVTGYSNARGDSAHVTALATSGPLSVGFKVASDFMRYKGGIYKRGYCSGGGHAVTSVGYTKDYFRMKNSWGGGWGESGYFRIARGNVCDITNSGFAPRFQSTGKKDDGTDEGGDDVDPTKDDGDDKVCTDTNSRCPEWAARDPSECHANWQWMTKNCAKSCRQCECVDVGTKCEEWKGKGYCEHTYENYMSKLCRKSCGKCDDDVTPTKEGDCQEGFKKCPDGSCVHEHWHC